MPCELKPLSCNPSAPNGRAHKLPGAKAGASVYAFLQNLSCTAAEAAFAKLGA